MPIYEYLCNNCRNVFETIVTSSCSSGEIVCKKCGSSDVKKTISLFSRGSSSKSTPLGGGLSSCAPRGGFS
ncbi:MAG: zinc ribbon domain-containing protein [Thermodesulfobacteriota bacterium]|nr:zinc ribbon domain-containing protein [Thermodesulfobacteriota bacterium]